MQSGYGLGVPIGYPLLSKKLLYILFDMYYVGLSTFGFFSEDLTLADECVLDRDHSVG